MANADRPRLCASSAVSSVVRNDLSRRVATVPRERRVLTVTDDFWRRCLMVPREHRILMVRRTAGLYRYGRRL